MRLTVFGCSGTYPGPTSCCSSYLLEEDGFRLLVDAGNGSTGTLQRVCGLLDIDAVIVSHMHGDHYLDLITYTYARRYHPKGIPPLLPVWGPSDVEEKVAGSFGRDVTDLLAEVYDFRPVAEPSTIRIGPFDIALDRMNHPVETYGMRFSAGGRVLAYSADTAPCDELHDVADGADVFLCEASYLDGEPNPPNIHLTGKEAGQAAKRANVGRLVLTHLVPWGDETRTLHEATQAFDGPIEVARTAAVFDI